MSAFDLLPLDHNPGSAFRIVRLSACAHCRGGAFPSRETCSLSIPFATVRTAQGCGITPRQSRGLSACLGRFDPRHAVEADHRRQGRRDRLTPGRRLYPAELHLGPATSARLPVCLARPDLGRQAALGDRVVELLPLQRQPLADRGTLVMRKPSSASIIRTHVQSACTGTRGSASDPRRREAPRRRLRGRRARLPSRSG